MPPHRCAARPAGRFTLSYDLTFLNLLLCSLYEGETALHTGADHCPIHPVRTVDWRSSRPTDYCADLSVALHYYNAQDKWKDDRSLLGLGYETLLAARTAAAAPLATAVQRHPRLSRPAGGVRGRRQRRPGRRVRLLWRR